MAAGQPYSLPADVNNQTLQKLAETQGGWVDADVALRIQEGDSIIDSLMAGMGYTLPFTGAANPPLLKQLSVLYGRYAVMRDLYAGNSPSNAPANAAKAYKDRFDELIKQLNEGQLSLVDSTGAVISRSKYDVEATAPGVVPFFDMDAPEAWGTAADPSYLGSDLVGGTPTSTGGSGPGTT